VFHATGFADANLPDTLTGNCGNSPGIACRLAWDVTHSPTATQVVKVYLAGPVSQAGRIAFVLVLALLVRFIFHRLINKITRAGGNDHTGGDAERGGRTRRPHPCRWPARSAASSAPAPSARSCAARSR